MGEFRGSSRLGALLPALNLWTFLCTRKCQKTLHRALGFGLPPFKELCCLAKLLKSGYIGDHIRDFMGRIKGNTRSLDYSSYGDARDASGSTLDGSKGCVSKLREQ